MFRVAQLLHYGSLKRSFMEKMITHAFNSLFLIIITGIFAGACSSPENATAPIAVENMAQVIDTGRWVFSVEQTIPMQGRSRAESGGYTVTYNPGKLLVYLPYIGRADAAANTFLDKSPLDFTSVHFSIDKREKKPGEWHITITPKDYNEVRTMDFIFYDNGRASLDVVLTGRSGISFRGRVDALK
jgi:hypothetical protein